MHTPPQRWLSLRVRILCAVVFVVGSLLPPYVPKAALSVPEAEESPDQFLFVEDGFLMKSSSLGEQGARLAYTEGIVHQVKDGDSLERIAQRYGIAVQTIQWANNLQPNVPIRPDQELLILPVNGVLHTVKRGQNLSAISQLYDIPVEEISRQNSIDGGFIVAGQQLIIPGGRPIVVPTQVAQKPPVKKDPTTPQPTTPAGTPAPPEAVEATATEGVLQMPCNNCFYTQYYHAGHWAVDIQTKGGGPIFAAEGGTVLRADTGWNGGYGNVIEVDHGNGLITVYGHNKELYVKEGDKVTRGQVISWMGNTGLVYGQTGIHIHFEVILNGVKKNPLLYLK
ncbi:MAG: peptidoglycan DD-metalloendopeptidase family protein [Candidatus Peregrinibacteria bacterium]|nr:peptidoglycan DD-metalloendopeptidase family protein [Candidatus Peregrinibacteria bacterium]